VVNVSLLLMQTICIAYAVYQNFEEVLVKKNLTRIPPGSLLRAWSPAGSHLGRLWKH
jgi:hypothetical protein